MPLLKSVIKPLGLLGLTAASSAIDVGVQKKVYLSGTTTFVISNEEMNDIMKIVQTLEDSGIQVFRYFRLKRVNKTIINETKEQKGGFLSIPLDTLGASLLGDLLTKNLSGRRIRPGRKTVRAGDGSSVKWTVLAHLESQPRGQNFQIQNLVNRSSPPYTRPNKNTNKHI